MIPDFKTFIKESIWSDIQDRSSGEVTRKEDDIDLLDVNGLYEYLKTHYRELEKDTITCSDEGVDVCLFEDEYGYYVFLEFNHIDTDPELYLTSALMDSQKGIRDALESKYTITTKEDYDSDGHPFADTFIEPKGCRYFKLKNRFFLEVLDYLIEKITPPIKPFIEKI